MIRSLHLLEVTLTLNCCEFGDGHVFQCDLRSFFNYIIWSRFFRIYMPSGLWKLHEKSCNIYSVWRPTYKSATFAYQCITQNRGISISWYYIVFNRFGTVYLDVLQQLASRIKFLAGSVRKDDEPIKYLGRKLTQKQKFLHLSENLQAVTAILADGLENYIKADMDTAWLQHFFNVFQRKSNNIFEIILFLEDRE